MWRVIASAAIVLAWTCALGVAQTPSIDAGWAAALELSPVQKLAIYQSISTTRKNNAAPPGFRAAVGSTVPGAIDLEPLPDAPVKLIPADKGLQVALIEKQAVLVDPTSRTVVAVVTQAE